MILGANAILAAMEAGEIVIEPFDMANLKAASVDLTLGREFVIRRLGNRTELSVPHLALQPDARILGHTVERVAIGPGIVARVEGKSTWGRKFLAVHMTAGFVDPGWDGQLTLEMANFSGSTIDIDFGAPICQISFERVELVPGPIVDATYRGMGGRYTGKSVEGPK